MQPFQTCAYLKDVPEEGKEFEWIIKPGGFEPFKDEATARQVVFTCLSAEQAADPRLVVKVRPF